MTDNQYHSIANPRRVTLASLNVAAGTAQRVESPALEMVGDDAPLCVDAVCDIPAQNAR